ncbi:MAG: nucleotide sugar dehydrogenase [Planctomycetota bacterium]|nr:nucleotide sugar dehydrogenase [Planctomycetota bacterium]
MIPEKIAVIGLGYVGLPVAVAFSGVAERVVGFDISSTRVAALRAGHDWTGEVDDDVLGASGLTVSDDPTVLAGASFYVVTVPTPVDGERRPDFGPLEAACRTIGPHLSKGAVVVFESTVYPGATDETCGPALAAASGLECGVDFTLGYSPERINPGDREHRLENIIKVVAGQDAETLRRVSAAYSAIIRAGVHEAPSIQVAEAAKVIENTQRDINIALMNELALIFERLGLRTKDVLDAAGTKWNFLPFTPGLVGGHCIGVDPYYLTAKAEAVGYHPQVILAGRRINDSMGAFVAQRAIKLMVESGTDLGRARVGLLGLTFKENVPDLRNSRSPDIARELRGFGIAPLVHDPEAGPDEVGRELELEMDRLEAFRGLDALILAVPHRRYIEDLSRLMGMVRDGGVFLDVKSAFTPHEIRPDLRYWSL